MPKGKAKSKFDFEKGKCEHEDSGWCNLSKGKRCGDRLLILQKHGGGAACRLTCN